MVENQKTIVKWALSTFGEPENGLSLINRLKEEVYELAAACVVYENVGTKLELQKIMSEIADVVVMAYQVCNWYGHDLHELVDKKMEINRNRKWKVMGNGIGQHVEEE